MVFIAVALYGANNRTFQGQLVQGSMTFHQLNLLLDYKANTHSSCCSIGFIANNSKHSGEWKSVCAHRAVGKHQNHTWLVRVDYGVAGCCAKVCYGLPRLGIVQTHSTEDRTKRGMLLESSAWIHSKSFSSLGYLDREFPVINICACHTCSGWTSLDAFQEHKQALHNQLVPEQTLDLPMPHQ